ncbi:MAG: DNRLRE domain-containing protein [Gemmatimonadetes bacterium]|nr:DNRLRE domain-containing protein [Gemmatimonadota bacterium]
MRSRVITALIALALVSACSDPSEPPMEPPVGEADLILDPSKDNTLFEESGELSNGAGQFLFAGMTRDTVSRRALVHFDLASAGIPGGSVIDSVQLVLRMDRTIVGDIDVSIHRVTTDWGEGASDADFAEGTGTQSEAGDATWIHRFYDTDLWTNPGGDFDAVPSATLPVGDEVRTYAWGSTARMVSDVQGWLDLPASNFGWIIIADESTHTTAKRFGSREEAPENRPKLRIFYTQP